MVQVLNPGGGKRFFSKMSRLVLAPTRFLFSGNQGSFPGVKQWGLKLTTHLLPVQRLRMSRAIPLLPLYAIMVWTGKHSLFIQIICIKIEKHFDNWLSARKR